MDGHNTHLEVVTANVNTQGKLATNAKQKHKQKHTESNEKLSTSFTVIAMKPLTVKPRKSMDSKILHGFTLGCQQRKRFVKCSDKVKNKIPRLSLN